MAAVALAASAVVVVGGVWASGVEVRAPFCAAASLQGFDVIRDPSSNPPPEPISARGPDST